MQRLQPERICEQAALVDDAYKSLTRALYYLKAARTRWSPELVAYLREEGIGTIKQKEDLAGVISDVLHLRRVTGNFGKNVHGLCKDLEAVGRGESFSV